MRRLVALLAACILLVSCSSNGAEGDTTTSTETAPTTTTSAPAATTSTTPETTTTTSRPTTTNPPPPTTTTEGDPMAPEGSGCTPGTDVLPDGQWYGEVATFDENSIGFDLTCWFTGDAAVQASAEDGEESPPPNDYYVRNQNDQIRVLVVDSDTPVTWYPSGDPNDVGEGTFSDWISYLEEADFRLGVWVTIEGGAVTGITEQWVP